METNVKEIKLEHGYILKTYNYEEKGKNYYILEVHKNNEIQFFEEVEIKQ